MANHFLSRDRGRPLSSTSIPGPVERKKRKREGKGRDEEADDYHYLFARHRLYLTPTFEFCLSLRRRKNKKKEKKTRRASTRLPPLHFSVGKPAITCLPFEIGGGEERGERKKEERKGRSVARAAFLTCLEARECLSSPLLGEREGKEKVGRPPLSKILVVDLSRQEGEQDFFYFLRGGGEKEKK